MREYTVKQRPPCKICGEEKYVAMDRTYKMPLCGKCKRAIKNKKLIVGYGDFS